MRTFPGPQTGDAAPPTLPAPAGSPWRAGMWSLPEVRWATAATLLFAAGGICQLAGAPPWLWWSLYLTCYAAGGWEPGLSGLKALRDRTLDVDLLMVVAAIGAAAIGQVFDGALLIVIFATSGALEALATKRTQDAVRGLLDLTPDQATRLSETGGEERVAAADLAVGEVILVRPGERIGADGHVVDGASAVDQAGITGESVPADKSAGDEVFAGTVNGTGVLRVRVSRPAAETVIARIVAMVEQAGATKARTQLFIEKIEQRYSVVMVAATVALFAVPLAWGVPLQDALLRAMTFMIVASPCAVVLATMPPLLAAIATAGRHGVLVKSAVVMEQLGTVTQVAFDKTGTLTEGRPHLTGIHVLPGAKLPEAEPTRTEPTGPEPAKAEPTSAKLPEAELPEAELPEAKVPEAELPEAKVPEAELTEAKLPEAELPERRLLALAAAAERGSEHPLGRAVVEAARAEGLTPSQAQEFGSEPGRGVRARVDGLLVEVASPAHLLGNDGNGDGSGNEASAARLVARLQEDGHTVVVVRVDGEVAGVLALADRMRPGAAGTVAQLTALTGTAPVLLTGDNPRAARRLATQAGITDVRAGLLPADKVTAVQRLQAQGARVAVVGDGVNDAPALAGAHVGIAMGRAGSDLTLDTADAVITRDELATVPAVIALARRARRLVVANLVIAFTFIAVLVAWDLLGDLPLPLGVAGHEGSTVIVGLNGLRLLRDAAWRRAARLANPS
ncbi:Lead, cadmium, zinc and mercury transporting ATPase; Copper-translocating P-type ATPase [[Actinomadura] parvosata subsp. kistnae]|nr:Lead, cadmium, zinc and mercury transporting ATPase; Copper-translocating P-type ATPase [Actinomadura parvosata subsp. kistnae]